MFKPQGTFRPAVGSDAERVCPHGVFGVMRRIYFPQHMVRAEFSDHNIGLTCNPSARRHGCKEIAFPATFSRKPSDNLLKNWLWIVKIISKFTRECRHSILHTLEKIVLCERRSVAGTAKLTELVPFSSALSRHQLPSLPAHLHVPVAQTTAEPSGARLLSNKAIPGCIDRRMGKYTSTIPFDATATSYTQRYLGDAHLEGVCSETVCCATRTLRTGLLGTLEEHKATTS
ncbi:hypothetical protein GWK47_023979 [Chionoecetes opilio]|uniref:Uncharacterized protein n=1 Tax=Chionoecetes opilio TaxID=41210 RepID=A0A8J4XLZ0_CHIOP|nr:hypothetical protein GWK47_023979 [Chionoecetes opilio]